MPTEPLVSAIMPTRGRQKWASEAVDMFFAQTWPQKELVVIDDQMEPSFPDRLTNPLVRYALAPRYEIGAKRNLAVGFAAGSIVCHWDSDDIYAADRIEHQVSLLLSNEADIVGYHIMAFQKPDGSRKEFLGQQNYCIGVSMCYWREIWEQRQYPPINAGEDGKFQEGRRVFTVADTKHRIVARAHPGNTCDKLGIMAKDWWGWRDVA